MHHDGIGEARQKLCNRIVLLAAISGQFVFSAEVVDDAQRSGVHVVEALRSRAIGFVKLVSPGVKGPSLESPINVEVDVEMLVDAEVVH